MTDAVGKIGFSYSTDLMKQTKTCYSGGGVGGLVGEGEMAVFCKIHV